MYIYIRTYTYIHTYIHMNVFVIAFVQAHTHNSKKLHPDGGGFPLVRRPPTPFPFIALH